MLLIKKLLFSCVNSVALEVFNFSKLICSKTTPADKTFLVILSAKPSRDFFTRITQNANNISVTFHGNEDKNIAEK